MSDATQQIILGVGVAVLLSPIWITWLRQWLDNGGNE